MNSVNPQHPWRGELRALLVIGVPMALTQMVQFSINIVDVIMIGQLSATALASAALGQVLFYVLFVAAMGPALAVAPMVSQSLGDDPDNLVDPRRSVRMGLWVVTMITLAFSALFFLVEEFALFIGQPAEAATLAEPYVLALAPGLPFALGVIVLRNFLAALERSRVPLLIIIVTTLVNAFLNWLLIYGNWGAPRLELVGAGIASSLSHAIGFFALVLYIRYERSARRFQLFMNFWRPDWPRVREVASLGWPITITIAFEAMLFNACVFLMGRIGIDEMAAYQVALNVAALAFMAPLGLSMAGGVRVGLMAGARNRPGVRRAATLAIVCSASVILVFAVPMLLLPETIAGLYLQTDDVTNIAVLGLVASFLPIAAAFALFDATQVAAAQALRGLKDVRLPMVITGFAYWVVGFPVATWLGLYTTVGALGIWYGLLSGLVVASVLLVWRLHALTRADRLG